MAKPVTLKTRVHGLYRAMVLRFGPKYWKSGRRNGQMREPGMDLPFTEAELLAWMERTFPCNIVTLCRYCFAPMDSLSCSLDHAIPISRNGKLGLSNLEAICEGCNRLKGGLKPSEFRSLMELLNGIDPAAKQDVLSRLKAGAMGMRLRYYKR